MLLGQFVYHVSLADSAERAARSMPMILMLLVPTRNPTRGLYSLQEAEGGSAAYVRGQQMGRSHGS